MLVVAVVLLGALLQGCDYRLESASDPAASVPPTPAAKGAATTDGEAGKAGHATDKASRHRTAEPPTAQQRHPRTFLVTDVVDGDTVDLGNGERVRLVGIDTPEVGECGFEQAAALMRRLVLGRRVRLAVSDEDRDRYGRLLRYVDVGSRDAGLAEIRAGLAIARYDSRDGYGFHPRENRYIDADRTTPDQRCAAAKPVPLVGAGDGGGGGASVYYQNCDAARAAGAAPVHRGDAGYGGHLDRDGDGVGCE
jgi:endonuclease YncB( thermonuclease family)